MNGDQFDKAFRSWTASYCQATSRQPPSEEWFSAAYKRLPQGLRETLGMGLARGSIIPLSGGKFTLIVLPSPKAYSWFSHGEDRPPYINWEWFVHAAEYARIHALSVRLGLEVKFEHDRMDIAVYREGLILACYEVKESPKKLDVLTSAVSKLGMDGVDPTLPDRNKDHLRKAKYLVAHRPSYFAAVAIGKRYEFSVEYTRRHQDLLGFNFRPDLIPLG